MVEVKRRVRHNGRRYTKGDTITDITVEQATALVESGAADWLRVKPDANTNSVANGNVDWSEEVKKYHKGFARYDIPGVGMVEGRDKAVEALKQAGAK